jgi:hypothetical protein
MKKIAVVICVVASCLSASVTFAGMVDLAVNNSGTVTAATGQLTTFERFNDPSTGTGVFEPFLRIQNRGMEKGYNTDGTTQFNTKKGTWTHSIKLGAIQTVKGCLEFLLDINESQGRSSRYLSLDGLKIFLADSPTLDNYAAGLGTLIFDLGDNWVKMDNTIFDPGSGTGDMRVLIPVSPDWSADKYLYLYSEFGQHNSSDAGFEEWSARTNAPPVPEPATLALLALSGSALLRKL